MNRSQAISQFTLERPSLSSYWRSIILFGQNVASYKFALGGALLELADGPEVVALDELALPFARRIAHHLAANDKQGSFQSSSFLDACRDFNRGELTEDALRAKTAALGFANVIDAFHVVDRSQVPERFFIDERRSGNGIRLTDAIRKLAATLDPADLEEEIESRWRLVETAWKLNLPRSVLTVELEQETSTIVVPRRRTAITGARGALNGYQKGHCFYCFSHISISPADRDALCHVDHLFPWSFAEAVGGAPVNGIWNLVLACPRCNSWHEKRDRPPHPRYVERLHRRNEYLIASHHPLSPTIVQQTGSSTEARAGTLARALSEVSMAGARAAWTAPSEGEATF